MNSRCVFAVGLCAALVAGPRAGGTGDAGSVSLEPATRALTSLHAQRVDAQLGVWADFDEAVGWLSARARAGDAAARYELAHMRVTGLLESRNAGETLALLTAAAEAGQDQAQLLLARLHEFGLEGLPRDPEQALKWYHRAAAASSTVDLRAAAEEGCRRLRERLTIRQIATAETTARLTWAGVRSITESATSLE